MPVEAPPRAFERMLVEACAYSEAARTVLVIDQLQAAAKDEKQSQFERIVFSQAAAEKLKTEMSKGGK